MSQSSSDTAPAKVESANVASAEAGTAQLEEVTVTAERVGSSVQRTAATIDVLQGDAVAEVTRAQDLTKLVPGLQVGATGAAAQVYIRGVGDQSTNLRAESGVSLNLDGIYLASGSQLTTSMYDIARIEVLKGPQGTLYGRNSSGGAINILTNAPALGKFGGHAGVSVGNYALVNSEAALNVPVGDTTALRMAAQIVNRNGYLSNGGDDQKTQAGRGKFLWKPSESFSLLVTGDASHIGGEGNGSVALPNTGSDPWRQNTQAPYPFKFQFGPGTVPYTTPNDASTDTDIW
jgi:iron complex outermembrane receptor protein